MKKTIKNELKINILSGHEVATWAAIDGFLVLVEGIFQQPDHESIQDNICRINGYVQALVNLDILDEKQANSIIRTEIANFAITREIQLETERK